MAWVPKKKSRFEYNIILRRTVAGLRGKFIFLKGEASHLHLKIFCAKKRLWQET